MPRRSLHGAPVGDDALRAEIAPCFRDDGARTDTVVLACTHYPLLIERLRRLAPWPVNFLDPAPAIARRVGDLLGPASSPAHAGTTRAIFTSGRAPRSAGALRHSFGNRLDRRRLTLRGIADPCRTPADCGSIAGHLGGIA